MTCVQERDIASDRFRLFQAGLEKYLRVPPVPMGLDDVGERAPQTPEVKRPKIPSGEEMMADDGDPQEPPKKISKSSEDTKQLYPPHYAGNVNQASFPVDDEAWEKEVKSLVMRMAIYFQWRWRMPMNVKTRKRVRPFCESRS